MRAQAAESLDEVRKIADTLKANSDTLAANSDALAANSDALAANREYTHEVGVQIYRNVQAALIDELAKQTADREEHCKVMQEKLDALPTEAPKQGSSGLLILTFLIAAGNLALMLWMCYSLGLLGV